MRRPTTRLLLAGAAVALTSGCAAGQIAQTADSISTVDGARGSVGAIELRNISFEAPDTDGWIAGDDVGLRFYAANEDPVESDELVAVTSEFFDGEAGQSLPVEIPAGQGVDFSDQGGATVELTGLTEQLYSSVRVDVTFSFQRAGDVTVSVPVGVSLDYSEEGKPTFDFHAQEETGATQG